MTNHKAVGRPTTGQRSVTSDFRLLFQLLLNYNTLCVTKYLILFRALGRVDLNRLQVRSLYMGRQNNKHSGEDSGAATLRRMYMFKSMSAHSALFWPIALDWIWFPLQHVSTVRHITKNLCWPFLNTYVNFTLVSYYGPSIIHIQSMAKSLEIPWTLK